MYWCGVGILVFGWVSCVGGSRGFLGFWDFEATTGFFVVGGNDGSVSCFQFGTLDPSAPDDILLKKKLDLLEHGHPNLKFVFDFEEAEVGRRTKNKLDPMGQELTGTLFWAIKPKYPNGSIRVVKAKNETQSYPSGKEASQEAGPSGTKGANPDKRREL
ncbi:hypothetical protein AgCh_021345 [Apium graveolens]